MEEPELLADCSVPTGTVHHFRSVTEFSALQKADSNSLLHWDRKKNKVKENKSNSFAESHSLLKKSCKEFNTNEDKN